VEYWLARQRHGDGMRVVAAALGIAPWSLYRWTRIYEQHVRFHPIQIVDNSPAVADASLVMVMRPDGLRIEGLDIQTAAQLLKLLR
jgi:hypothetical protein